MPTFGAMNRFAPPPPAPPLQPLVGRMQAPAPSPYQGRAAAPQQSLVGRMAAPPPGAPAGFGRPQYSATAQPANGGPRYGQSLGAAPVQRTSNSLGVSASTPGGEGNQFGAQTPQQARAASYGQSMGQPGGGGNQLSGGLPNPQRAAGANGAQMKTVNGYNFY